MNINLDTVVEEILGSSIYPNIATVDGDHFPWNTPVYGVFDSDLNLYWKSWVKSQHSLNIDQNEDIFVTLYDSNRKLGQNHQRCLYIKAKAKILRDESVESVLEKFENRGDLGEFTGNSLKKIYKAIPQKIWINNMSESQVTENTQSMRFEIDINKIKKSINY